MWATGRPAVRRGRDQPGTACGTFVLETTGWHSFPNTQPRADLGCCTGRKSHRRHQRRDLRAGIHPYRFVYRGW